VRVLSLTVECSDNARDTVIFATPSSRATSAMVGRARSLGLCVLIRDPAWRSLTKD
jgi:hypothetical protein